MQANELADQIERIIISLRERIMGVGAEQYDEGNVQKIELKKPSEIIAETIEEIDDSIVYLSHLRARMTKIQSTLGNALDLFNTVQPYASLNLEMSEQIKKVRHLHRQHLAIDDSDYCAIDNETWPCITIKTLNDRSYL